MLRRLHVENFKSIDRLDFEPGRFNVLIGENGSGKSNVLEALAFAGAAWAEKTDNEFLVSRGVRVSEGKFMRSAWSRSSEEGIKFVISEDVRGELELEVLESSQDKYPRWKAVRPKLVDELRDFLMMGPDEIRPVLGVPEDAVRKAVRPLWSIYSREEIEAFRATGQAKPTPEQAQRVAAAAGQAAAKVIKAIEENARSSSLASFLAYSPEASSLRTFEREGQIVPLGIAGEGLFKLLQVLAADEKDPARFAELKENLRLLDWFESIEVTAGSGGIQERSVRLRDRFIPEAMGYFDQRSANEAFLFILFYLALFVSADTPSLFGIDNIDASLNPKTCRELIRRLTGLAKKYDKQVVATTHNPAVLDGLDLNDDEQRLFVVRRGRKGDTKLKRIMPPQPVAGEPPIKLSDAFLRGLLGGLPQNF